MPMKNRETTEDNRLTYLLHNWVKFFALHVAIIYIVTRATQNQFANLEICRGEIDCVSAGYLPSFVQTLTNRMSVSEYSSTLAF